jgi:Lycopene cyclase protein
MLAFSAGQHRPSTGYAFLETIADCQRLGRQISHCAFPMTSVSSRRPLRAYQRAKLDLWMDALFLQVLAVHWPSAPALFMAMFQRAPTECLVRFLSNQASWSDRARVALSLPKRRFLRGLMGRWLHPACDLEPIHCKKGDH